MGVNLKKFFRAIATIYVTISIVILFFLTLLGGVMVQNYLQRVTQNVDIETMSIRSAFEQMKTDAEALLYPNRVTTEVETNAAIKVEKNTTDEVTSNGTTDDMKTNVITLDTRKEKVIIGGEEIVFDVGDGYVGGRITFYKEGRFACFGHEISEIPEGKTERLMVSENEMQLTEISNTKYGIFGNINVIPDNPVIETAEEIREGIAYLYVQRDNRIYSISIYTITDEYIIAEVMTDWQEEGGCVQGMSGTPVFQDGYLIGAVSAEIGEYFVVITRIDRMLLSMNG